MYKVLTPNIKPPYKFLLACGHFPGSFGCYRVQRVNVRGWASIRNFHSRRAEAGLGTRLQARLEFQTRQIAATAVLSSSACLITPSFPSLFNQLCLVTQISQNWWKWLLKPLSETSSTAGFHLMYKNECFLIVKWPNSPAYASNSQVSKHLFELIITGIISVFLHCCCT